MSSPHFVDSDGLVAAAGRLEAAGLLPELVQRLVRFESEPPTSVTFRTGTGIRLGGYDGEVNAPIKTAHVPDGDSVWELTAQDPNASDKASKDFDKRTGDTEESVRAKTTYVGVSLRRWSAKDKWADDQREAGWREVRFLDADDLWEWLCYCPPVHIWISSRLGLAVDGIRVLEDWFEDWAYCGINRIGRDWLLSGRDDVAQKLADTMLSQQLVQIVADSENEAVAFLASVILTSTEENLTRLGLRTLVVEQTASLQHLASTVTQCVLVAKCDLDDSHPGQVTRNNRLVMLQYPSGHNVVNVPKVDVGRLAERITDSGIDRYQAEEAARMARNGVEHLRQRLGAPSRFFRLIRKRAPDPRILAAVLLADRWSSDNEDDQHAVATLAGVSYADTLAWIQRLPSESPPLLRKSGRTWFVTDPPEAWRTLGQLGDPAVLARFGDHVSTVLMEDDPSYELDPSERWKAGLYARSPLFSSAIKQGAARSIGLLAAQNPDLSDGSSGKALAERLVTNLLDDAAPQRWYSLAPLLPLLAEAAPDEFLEALETDLLSERPNCVAGLLSEDNGPLMSSSRHHHLLWALERLAWAPLYLPRVAVALARLAQIGFGASGNNPASSLAEVFRPWRPCTTATLDERLSAIDLVRKQFPSAAWGLLLSQIPQRHAVGMPTSRPELRPWVSGDQPRVPRQEVSRAGLESLNWAIADAGTDAVRWADLASRVLGLGPDWAGLLLDALEKSIEKFSPEESTSLWERLRGTWHHHRRFPDAEWGLEPGQMKRLEAVLAALAPKDSMQSDKWLFEQWVDLPEQWKREGHNYEEEQRRLGDLREESVRSIFEQSGEAAVERFAGLVAAPYFVGRAAADLRIWRDEEGVLFLARNLGEHAAGRHGLAVGFATRRIEVEGGQWLRGILRSTSTAHLTPSQRAELCNCADYSMDVWRLVESAGDDTCEAYWRSVPHLRIPTTGVEGRYALDHLLAVGRAAEVVDLLALAPQPGVSDFPDELALTALSLLRDTAQANAESIGRLGYEIGQVIDRLVERGHASLVETARLEFFFMPVLGYLREPRALGQALAGDPELLVELVCMAFKAKGREKREPTEQEAALAQSAYMTLDNWRIVPGTGANGDIDVAALRDYVRMARQLASQPEIDRAEVLDEVIGRVLAASPEDPSGMWPHESVCELFEVDGTKELGEGFVVGVLNSRGVTMRAPYAGGDLERAEEAKYEGLAKSVRPRFPKCAALLQRVADDYGRQAKREDDEASQRQDLNT